MPEVRGDALIEAMEALERHVRQLRERLQRTDFEELRRRLDLSAAFERLTDDVRRAQARLVELLSNTGADPRVSTEAPERPAGRGDAELLEAMNAHYAELKRDSTAWAEHLAERDLWERAGADGLNGDG